MVTKKDLIIVILCTLCLTSTLFMMMPTRSSSSNGVYDPWMDLNDDGVIDSTDLGILGALWGTTGTPINKTALLLELQSRIDSLNTSLLNLEAYLKTRIVDLNASLVEQQSRIAELESKIAVLNATKLGEPDWDSLDTYGWISIPAGQFQSLTHNLHTTNVLVYMVGYDYDGYSYHQIAYGGDSNPVGVYGAWWSQLTETSIVIWRLGSDIRWDLIRVMIWKIP